MPQPARSEMPAVTIGDWIYVPGGFGDPTRLDRYNPETDQWQTLAQMPAGRHHLMATAYGDKIYLFGGATAQSWEPPATVWVYDPASDTWQELPPMPEPRLAGAAVTLNDKIYIAGGAGGSQDLLEFSPDQADWRPLSAPNQAREHVNAVVFEDEIWFLGGRWSGEGELASVEIYTPATDTWRNGPPMQVPRAGFAAAVVDGHIVVAGGEVVSNGTETLASVEMLTPGSAGWQMGPSLPVPIHGVGGDAFDHRMLLLGGSIRAGAIENEGQVQIYNPLE
jgi:N-acetylneuraminic acid mutarotase